MAISGANLIGANPVYDTSRSVGTYTANLQKQAAQRAAEQKSLQDDLNKIKIDGLRDADKDKYFEKYNEWRNEAQGAYKERNNEIKFKKQSNADVKFLELQDFINQSKNYNKVYQDFKGKLMDNRFRDQFSDDAVKSVQDSDKLSISDPRFIRDFTPLERQLDFNKINTEFSKINDYLKKNAVDSNQPLLEDVTLAGDKGVKITPYAKVDPRIQAEKYVEIFDNNRDFKKMWMQQRPDLFENPNLSFEEAKLTLIDDLIKNNPLERRGSSTYKWKDKSIDKMLLNDSLIRKRHEDGVGGSGSNEGTYRQQTIGGLLTKDKDTLGRIRATLIPGSKIDYHHSPTSGKQYINIATPISKDGMSGGETVNIDINDPNAATALNTYLNLITGEKVSSSKTGIVKGKPTGELYEPEVRKSVKGKQPSTIKMVTMILPNGQTGQIPEQNVKQFLKDNPKAKRR